MADRTDSPQAQPLQEEQRQEEQRLIGTAVSPGIAIAPAVVFAAPELAEETREIDEDGITAEIDRFERARGRAVKELNKIVTFAREKLGDASAEIFYAQVMALEDAALREAVAQRIRDRREGADHAIRAVLGDMRLRVESSSSEYIRERAGDLSDVQHRLLRNLQHTRAVSRIAPDHIVIAETLSAADLLLFSRHRIRAVAMDYGGPTSHVSIMARSLGVPAVVSLHGVSNLVRGGEAMIVDGFSGRVVINPSEQTVAEYEERLRRYRLRALALREQRDLPAETACGVRIAVRANIELEEEVPLLKEYGADGVGLFRTEMLLLVRGRPLTEDEQYEVYRGVVQEASPEVTTFRLLDLGGDKMLPMAHREHNPFLGWRGVRVLLDKPEILRPQLRAIARVAEEGPVRILVPMVSSIDEVHRVKALCHEVFAEGPIRGLRHIPFGVMVEVPSVALAIDRFAVEVDFLSIGSNDLTQFLLAVDRGNDLVSTRYRELNPVVLRLIKDVIDAGKRWNLPVSLCGEMAGNPRVAPLLVGLGLREFSASPTFLPDVKAAIRATTIEDAEALAQAALAQPDAQSVLTLATQWLTEHLPELAYFFNEEADAPERPSWTVPDLF